MNIKVVKNTIKKYLVNSFNSKVLFININNNDDYEELCSCLPNFSKIKKVSSYTSNYDLYPVLEKLCLDISNSNEEQIVLGLGEYLNFLNNNNRRKWCLILAKLMVKSRSIILAYQLDDVLMDIIKNDLRLKDNICLVESNYDYHNRIVFMHTPSYENDNQYFYKGFKECLETLETHKVLKPIYTITKNTKALFSDSKYVIDELDSYQYMIDVIRDNDFILDKKFGTDEYFDKLLLLINEHDSFSNVVEKKFKTLKHLDVNIDKYINLEKFDKWLYFIALKIYKTENEYLNKVVDKTVIYDDLERNIIFEIANFDYDDKNFDDYYKERKKVLDNSSYIQSFCNFIIKKEKNQIYYLTDTTINEKERIIECLCTYEYENIRDILEKTYNDLFLYLEKYNYGFRYVNDYFNRYKYLKVFNKHDDEFLIKVKELAIERPYNRNFSPRAEIFSKEYDSYSKDNTEVFFIDCLGIEYLSYIISKLNKYEVSADVKIALANIPTVTERNIEFKDEVKSNLLKNIKELDEIKHKYYKGLSRESGDSPVYIVQELDVIDKELKNVISSVRSGRKVIIVSDHGASRLAVTNAIRVDIGNCDSKKGGRYCFSGNVVSKYDYVAEDEGHYVIGDYHRFSGSRAASTEVHGGATLEEILVPIITISDDIKPIDKIELQSKTIEKKRTGVNFKIFSSIKRENLVVEYNGKRYNSKTSDNQNFEITIENIKKAGTYTLSIISDDIIIEDDFEINVVNLVAEENDFFGDF